MTLFQLVILVLFIAAGFAAIEDDPGTLRTFEPFFPNGFGGVFVAMGLTFIAFEGQVLIVKRYLAFRSAVTKWIRKWLATRRTEGETAGDEPPSDLLGLASPGRSPTLARR